MADVSILELPSTLFTGDSNAQLVAGDNPAVPRTFNDTMCWQFDATDEAAIITSSRVRMPTTYAAGTTKAEIHFFMESDNTNDIALDVFVEAVTPNTDTLDLESATSWDTANSGTVSLSGSTAGDLLTLTITLTNKDSLAAGDGFRIGVRRDTDSANDDASGNLYIASVHILEDQ